MKLICENAADSGLPGASILLLFTKSAWLTNEQLSNQIRSHMLGNFEDVAGILVNGREFFDVSGSWPVAFTIWRLKDEAANLDPNRAVPLIDLTWLKKDHLASIPWSDIARTDGACRGILASEESPIVQFGEDRTSIREWSGRP